MTSWPPAPRMGPAVTCRCVTLIIYMSTRHQSYPSLSALWWPTIQIWEKDSSTGDWDLISQISVSVSGESLLREHQDFSKSFESYFHADRLPNPDSSMVSPWERLPVSGRVTDGSRVHLESASPWFQPRWSFQYVHTRTRTWNECWWWEGVGSEWASEMQQTPYQVQWPHSAKWTVLSHMYAASDCIHSTHSQGVWHLMFSVGQNVCYPACLHSWCLGKRALRLVN
jgi:hypothetical protein